MVHPSVRDPRGSAAFGRQSARAGESIPRLLALVPALLLVGCAAAVPQPGEDPVRTTPSVSDGLPAPKGHELVGSYSFAVPSGDTCVATYFFPDHADDDLLATAHSVFDRLTAEDIGPGVDEAIEAARRTEGTAVDADGNEVPAGYGTEWYPEPDVEYSSAVTDAIGTLLRAEWSAAGIDAEQPQNSTHQMAMECDGESRD